MALNSNFFRVTRFKLLRSVYYLVSALKDRILMSMANALEPVASVFALMRKSLSAIVAVRCNHFITFHHPKQF